MPGVAWACPVSDGDVAAGRGEMENRIKEQQLDLFADRTSAHTMRANQMRLYFSSFAYVLMHALRRLGTEGTQFARAQCVTLRLKLLKIGARVKITARRIWLSFSQAYPYAKTFTQVLVELTERTCLESVRIAFSATPSRESPSSASRRGRRTYTLRHQRPSTYPKYEISCCKSVEPPPTVAIGAVPTATSARSASFTRIATRNGRSVTDAC